MTPHDRMKLRRHLRAHTVRARPDHNRPVDQERARRMMRGAALSGLAADLSAGNLDTDPLTDLALRRTAWRVRLGAPSIYPELSRAEFNQQANALLARFGDAGFAGLDGWLSKARKKLSKIVKNNESTIAKALAPGAMLPGAKEAATAGATYLTGSKTAGSAAGDIVGKVKAAQKAKGKKRKVQTAAPVVAPTEAPKQSAVPLAVGALTILSLLG